MALKFITAEEAASFVHHDDNVGFSGFTPAGCPKVVPGAIAKKAIAEHEKGNPFQIGMFTGASTGDKLDGELARANAIKSVQQGPACPAEFPRCTVLRHALV